jgi:class 3 adenylate cyclase/tetratricopeptide (TPR) repeat protein
MAICERCGSESPDSSRFCGACGALLPEVTAVGRQVRKVVTALFCDVTGSTALGEELDPEVLRGVMNRYFEEMRATIERHGGTVEKFIGDAVMAVFGIPRVHEDDALRAVRAAAEIRERLPAVAAEVGVTLRFRTGVNTGTVLMGEGENLAIGDAVNVAARLEQAAQPGEIVLGADTLLQVRDAVEVEPLEPLALKGKSERVPAFRLLRIDPVAPGVARHLEITMVGRRRELHLLSEAWERTVQESGCHLFTVLGAAGAGKSRLVAELLADVGPATVLQGRCLPYGEAITFWPLVEALMPLGESAERILDRLSSGGVATPEELFWEVRRLLERLAAARPVIFHVDDLQWAEPMLLDLLDHIVDISRGAPILLLCTARPELLEDRPAWGGGKFNAASMLLEPLDVTACETLVDQLGDGLDPRARAEVVAASAGNPLFLEEMVSFARERGMVQVPSTIQALLAARLEHLAAGERELLERGAVEGEVFHRLAVRALAGERLPMDLDSRLAGLVRKELIRPHPATLGGDDAFRFRHLLIRDAAYDGLPKATRADLHERFAAWLEDAAADLVELDEIAGWHMEEAVRYRQELGSPVDPALGRRAAHHLQAAGRRARERSDSAAARNLFERALALAPESDSLKAMVGVDLAEELIEAGDLARADELISVAEDDSAAAALGALNRFEWLIRARPHEAAAIEAALPAMLEQLDRAGDERGMAKAHLAAYWVHWSRSHATAAGHQVRLAAEHARRAFDDGLRLRALGYYMAPLIFGSTNAASMARELETLEREESSPYLAGHLNLAHGQLARLEGRFDEARRLTETAIEFLQSMGLSVLAAAAEQRIAELHLLEGNAPAALGRLLVGDAVLEQMGERAYRSTLQSLLAWAHELLGDRDAALAAIDLSEELGGPEDAINFVNTHGVRARLALVAGEGDTAERWARSAVRYAFMTDFPISQGDAQLDLARALSALGRQDEASAEARRALECYELKGDRPGATKARMLLEGLGART